MSFGNRVFLDDGTGGGTSNDGVMDGGENPIPNVRLELWRDTNGTPGLQMTGGTPDTSVGFDVTDAGGYYLFDRLVEGSYFVHIPSGNFTASFDPDNGGPIPSGAGALQGYNSSGPTGTENIGVGWNPYTPNMDRDDNGVNDDAPHLNGISSGIIVLTLTTEPISEAELSAEVDPGSPTNDDFDPTGWDGPVPSSRGRWSETDDNSNLTIDFGFYPVVSIGSIVWSDSNRDGIQTAGEPGISGATVTLLDGSGNPVAGVSSQATGVDGLYYFGNLPQGDYRVRVQMPVGYTPTINQNTANNDDSENDFNIATSIGDIHTSGTFTLTHNGEPNGVDSNIANSDNGDNVDDNNGNMTVDFGFYPVVSIGSIVWDDLNQRWHPDRWGARDCWGYSNITRMAVATRWQACLRKQQAQMGFITSSTLPQGDYRVRVQMPAGYSPTINQQTANNDDLENDFNIATSVGDTHTSGTFTLTHNGEPRRYR